MEDEGTGGEVQQDFRPRCMVQVPPPERPAASPGFNSAQTTHIKVMRAYMARLHPPTSFIPFSLPSPCLSLSQDDHKPFTGHTGDTKVALVLVMGNRQLVRGLGS